MHSRMPPAFLMRGARHATHDMLHMRASTIHRRHISDGGLTPTTETGVLLACKGGSHPHLRCEPNLSIYSRNKKSKLADNLRKINIKTEKIKE